MSRIPLLDGLHGVVESGEYGIAGAASQILPKGKHLNFLRRGNGRRGTGNFLLLRKYQVGDTAAVPCRSIFGGV
jgi:hypothetical protein